MPTRAKGLIVASPGARAAIEEFTIPDPGPGDVTVRVLACGVCHSDLHAKRGDFGDRFPYLLGHEATAIVEAVGDGVTTPALGDTVALTWRAPCGRCRYCAAGNPVLCNRPAIARTKIFTDDGKPLMRVLGLGTLATHSIVAAGQAIPVAADLPPSSTCLIGCCVATGVGSAVHTAAVKPGETVAVFGCGAVGLSVLQGARIAGASRLFAVDLHQQKLEWAKTFGATELVDASAGDPVAAIRSLTGDVGVTVAFDAVGIPRTIAQALESCEYGGRAVMIGVPTKSSDLTLSLPKFFYARSTLITSFFGDCVPEQDFPQLVNWYRSGDLKIDELVTNRIRLEDVEDAFEAMERGETLRAVVVF